MFCVGVIPFSICFEILQEKWLNIFAICFFYQLSIIVNVPNLLSVNLLMLIISLIPAQI